MENIKFSVVVTVLNEGGSIDVLIQSLLKQRLKPDEIIFVDAGSTDSTVEIIKGYEKKSVIPIRLLKRRNVNRSVGRNIGIALARNSYIAVTDAGCEVDACWLEELAMGFDKNIEAVAGFYLPVIKQPIQRLFSLYVSTLSENFDEETYLPSSRSLAFTKSLWKSVGKYPAHLNTCEDLVFAANLKKTGKMVVQRKALVFWRQANDFSEFFAQLRGYARGDVNADYKPHVFRIVTVWLRYGIFSMYPNLFVVYILYPLVKFNREIKNADDVLNLIMIQFTADAAVLVGSFQGLLDRFGIGKR